MPSKISMRSTVELGAVASAIPVIFGAWMYLNSHFALAADLSSIANTLEQSQLQLRMDVLEDRIDRETEKIHPNSRRIEKMQSQIDRLELRYEALIKKEISYGN